MSDLIIKGAGDIKDGLYNIKDGKLFKYKANGGTVRTYQIVSAGWIPCSERLPSEEEAYEVLCCDKQGNQLVAHPYKNEYSNTGFCAESEECYLYDCVAWMPLPEPYKESEE